MKIHTIRLVLLAVLAASAMSAQEAVQPASGEKSLAATMNVYVFPKTGQPTDRQPKDEADCYQWAVQNTGTDPFQLQKQAEARQQQDEASMAAASEVGRGSGAKGAVGGAAAGALIGAIADDTGEGAAIGAAVGVVAGRRRGRMARAESEQAVAESAAQAQQATATQAENFKKAFSVCLEAKDYLVKY